MRRIFILLTIILSLQIRLQAQKYTIENCVSALDSSNFNITKTGAQFWFIDSTFINGQTLKLSIVKPGMATHSPHKHIEDEIFFILEGVGEFYLNGKTVRVTANTSLYCPSMYEHNLKNIGNTDLKYLVLKKY